MSASFTSPTTAQQVIEHLEQNQVTEISCRSVFDDETIQIFHDAVISNRRLVSSLQSLQLQANDLSSCSLPYIARIMQSASNLIHVDLSENHLGDTCNNNGLEGLVDVLTSDDENHFCCIQSLNLNHNKIGPKAGHPLARLLRRNTTIHTLSLGQNSLGTKTIKAIAPALCQNSTLKHLDLSYNKLSDRGITWLAAVLEVDNNASQLATLDLQYNKIGPAGAHVLAKTLLEHNNKYLTCLNLSLNCIGPDGAQSLGAVIKYSHVLEELHLGRNDLSSGVLPLLQGLAESQVTRLRVLDLSWNSLTDEAAVYLAEHVLVKNSHLAELNLASNAIGDKGVVALARALPADMGLQELNIIGNQARDESAYAMADVLTSRHCCLQTLKWEKNNFTEAGKIRLRAAFAYRENLRKWLDKYITEMVTRKVVTLDFSRQRIGDNELIAISRALVKHKPRVPTLWINGDAQEGKHIATDSDDDGASIQFVTSRGISIFVKEVLAKNSGTVERLYIDRCSRIEDEGWTALAQALVTNTSLVILSISGSNVSMRAVQQFASALQKNRTVQRINLSDNKLGDEVVGEVSRMIQNGREKSVLKSINLCRNNITDRGLASLQSLGADCALQELHLAGNSITDAGALDLAKACIKNSSLKWVNLSQNRLSYRGKRALKLFLPEDAVFEADEQRR